MPTTVPSVLPLLLTYPNTEQRTQAHGGHKEEAVNLMMMMKDTLPIAPVGSHPVKATPPPAAVTAGRLCLRFSRTHIYVRNKRFGKKAG